jgi:hypothetical protein
MRRRVWFEPSCLPGFGFRAVHLGPSRGVFGWLGMQRVLWRDYSGRCRITNETAGTVECDR